MENPSNAIKMDDLGVPLFSETSILYPITSGVLFRDYINHHPSVFWSSHPSSRRRFLDGL